MPQAIVMPEMGMYMEEGVLTAWLRPAGASVRCGEPILEITTEKVTFEIPSPAAGILHCVAEAGATLRVQALLGYIIAQDEAASVATEREIAPLGHERADLSGHSLTSKETSPCGSTPKASPAARRLAVQHRIDLHLVKGTGPGGRIVEADILARISQQRT